MNDDLFFELKTKHEGNIQQHFAEEGTWIRYNQFHGVPIFPDVFLKETLLQEIHKQFPIYLAGMIEIAPETMYNWHTDARRLASLNLLLNPEIHYHTLYAPGYKTDVLQQKTIELTYKKGYLLSIKYYCSPCCV